MTRAGFNKFCAALPATTHVVQWGGADVWKVGGKVFAVARFEKGRRPAITFKVTDFAYEVLHDAPGLRPAPYLASRGLKWIQDHDEPGLDDRELKRYLKDAHHLVARGLTKKARRELGLDPE